MQCGLIQKVMDKIWKKEIQEIYGKYQMYSLTDGSDQTLFGEGMTRAERLVEILSAQLPEDFSGSIIDIGCGTGGFLQAFGAKFPYAALYGREIDDKNLRYLRRIPNFRRLYTDAVYAAEQAFDIITAIHCFEHIFDYESFFGEIENISKGSTKLLLQMPDVAASPFDIAIADHAAHFSKATLATCLGNYRKDFSVTSFINKELTAFTGDEKINDGKYPSASSREDYIRALDVQVDYLKHLLDKIDTKHMSEFGVYGTTIAGAWLTGIFSDHIAFYVDDDPLKQGKKFYGKDIIAPEEVAGQVKIVMPFTPPVMQAILQRHPNLVQSAVYCDS